ncbi:MAG: dolichyl-phosphate beta-glucosyltransferase [bacterium]
MAYSTDQKIFLSIIIPAYNEEDRIGPSLDTILLYLDKQNYPWELIILDDGSIDKTEEVVLKKIKIRSNCLLIKNDKRQGKGVSVKKGVLHSRGSYILFSDADLSTPIEEVERLLSFLQNGCDIAIGSRGKKDSKILRHQVWLREYMGKTFNLLIKLILFKGIDDTQCGFKCYTHQVAKDLFSAQSISGFCFDVENLYLAKKKNYLIKEVPVRWFHKERSKVRIFRDSLRMFFDLLVIRLRHRS